MDDQQYERRRDCHRRINADEIVRGSEPYGGRKEQQFIEGVVLQNINANGIQVMLAAVTGKQTSIQSENVGILVTNSNYVTLDGQGENPSGPGIGTMELARLTKMQAEPLTLRTAATSL